MSENSRPLVTFALFAYNQEKYIEEAIYGALNQTYSPLEIVISDDCSTDRTFEIISEVTSNYLGPHKLIINRNSKNLGLAANVNKVFLELAHGEWLVTAAGDDVSMPDRVNKMWQTVSYNPNAKGFHCSVKSVDESGVTLSVIKPKKIHLGNIHFDSMLGAAAAYHRDVIDLFGPIDRLVQNEDMVLSLRALLIGSIVSTDEICVLWRRHSNNMSGKINSLVWEQLKFLYCNYYNKKIYSNIQQLRDTLFVNETLKAQSLLIADLENRFLRTIKFGWSITRLSSYLFEKKPVQKSIKFNPILWSFLISQILKTLIASYLKRLQQIKSNS